MDNIENVAPKAVKKGSAWTSELVANVTRDYDGGKGMTVEAIAEKYNLGKRSVLGKLVSEKVYVKAEKVTPTYVDTGPTKKEYLKRLADLGVSEEAIKGLTNATKNALAEVADRIQPVAANG